MKKVVKVGAKFAIFHGHSVSPLNKSQQMFVIFLILKLFRIILHM